MPIQGSFSGSLLKGRTPAVPIVTGGTLYSDATYYYRLFKANGTLTVSGNAVSMDAITIAGGGGGGPSVTQVSSGVTIGGGGGGAGGLITGTYNVSGSCSIVIGGGGASPASNNPASNGTNTTVSNLGLTAVGGGAGGYYNGTTLSAGASGGSGGGGVSSSAGSASAGGSGTSGQGNAGNSGVGGTGLGGGAGGGAITAATYVSAANRNRGGDGYTAPNHLKILQSDSAYTSTAITDIAMGLTTQLWLPNGTNVFSGMLATGPRGSTTIYYVNDYASGQTRAGLFTALSTTQSSGETWTLTQQFLAGGGGAFTDLTSVGEGVGGAGNSGANGSDLPTDGAPNHGGGGGGGYFGTGNPGVYYNGGYGGSGVFMVRYLRSAVGG